MELNLDERDMTDPVVRSDDGTMSVDSDVKVRLKMKVVSRLTGTVEGTSVYGNAPSTLADVASASTLSTALGGHLERNSDILHRAGYSEERPGQLTGLVQDQQDGLASSSPPGETVEASGPLDHDRHKPPASSPHEPAAQAQRSSKEDEDEDYPLDVYFEKTPGKKKTKPGMAEQRASDPNRLLDRNTGACERGLKEEPNTHHDHSPPWNTSQPLQVSGENSEKHGRQSPGRQGREKSAEADVGARLPQPFVVVTSAGVLSSLVQSFADSGSSLPSLLYTMPVNMTAVSSSPSLSLLCTSNTAGSKTPNSASSVSQSVDSGRLFCLDMCSPSQAESGVVGRQTGVNASDAPSLPQVFVGGTSSFPALSRLLAERLAPVLSSVTPPGKISTKTDVTSSPTPQLVSSGVALSSSVSPTLAESTGSRSSVQGTSETCHDTATSWSHTPVSMSAKMASGVPSYTVTTPVTSRDTCDMSLSSSLTSDDSVPSSQPQNSLLSNPPPLVIYNVTPLLVLPQMLFDSIVSSSSSSSSSSLVVDGSGEDEAEDDRTDVSENELPCDKCSQTFKTPRDLRKHKLNHGRKSHKCEECGESFLGSWQLQRHKRTHSKGKRTDYKVCHQSSATHDRVQRMRGNARDKPYVCDVCNKGFNNARLLSQHKRNHPKPKVKHECSVCNMTFDSGTNLKKHHKTHASASSAPLHDVFCEQCGKKFISAKSQENHVCKDKKNQTTDVQSLTCGRCGKTFTSRICLQIHVHCTHMDSAECFDLDKNFFSEHKGPDLQKRVKKPAKSGPERFVCPVCGKGLKNFYTLQIHERIHKKPFTCKVCNKGFSHYHQMKRHQHVHTGVKDFTCEICQKSFISSQTLKLHYTGIHLGDKPFVCDVCNQGFVTRHTLKLHKLKHSDKKPFACEVCGCAFKYECVLKSHRLLHLGEKPFKCDVCDKAYVCKNYLTKHKRRAHSDPKYTCDVCGKTCYFANELKNHKLIHTDERPYSCEVCSKSFHTMLRLKNHKRIHSEEKPFTCNVCDKVFVSVGTLNSHNKRVHSGRTFVCEVCKKGFKNYESLKDHMNVHLQLKNFVCDECGKDFYSSNSLNTHKKLKHMEIKNQFVCNVCGKSFPFPSYLREHEKTHTKEKTLVCELCNKAVKYKLSRHMKRVHNFVKTD